MYTAGDPYRSPGLWTWHPKGKVCLYTRACLCIHPQGLDQSPIGTGLVCTQNTPHTATRSGTKEARPTLDVAARVARVLLFALVLAAARPVLVGFRADSIGACAATQLVTVARADARLAFVSPAHCIGAACALEISGDVVPTAACGAVVVLRACAWNNNRHTMPSVSGFASDARTHGRSLQNRNAAISRLEDACYYMRVPGSSALTKDTLNATRHAAAARLFPAARRSFMVRGAACVAWR